MLAAPWSIAAERGAPSGSGAVPVPQLESERVRRRPDLEHDAVPARAVHGAGRDQEVVVPLRRPAAHVQLVGEARAALLRAPQLLQHRLAVDPLAQTQIHAGAGGGLQQVVAPVLRECIPKRSCM